MARDNGPTVRVGYITTTHGNRGEIQVIPLTDFPERFAVGSRLLLETPAGTSNVAVVDSRHWRGRYVIRLDAITDMTAAAALRGCYLSVPMQEVKPLPEGHFYHFQLVGLEVYDRRLGYLGRISDVMSTGSNDVLVAEDARRKKKVLIPALKSVVRRVDVGAGRMEVDLPVGLAEEGT